MSHVGTQSNPRAMTWAGIVFTVMPALVLLLSAGMKLAGADVVREGFAEQGFPEGAALGIGIVELVATVIYLVPRTAVLGAILLTGYLGGAVVTHLRMSDAAYIMPIILGVLLWLGLFLRDPRLRALLPIVRGYHS